MQEQGLNKYIKICLLNLLLVAVWGSLMRYKIGFDFPFFNQKFLLHAHSHFAFSGWVSLLIFALILKSILEKGIAITRNYNPLLLGYLLSAYGMLISFSAQGYGLFSIAFSSISLIISIILSFRINSNLKKLKNQQSSSWFRAALLFNVLSAIGTAWLSYMMAGKSVNQHSYLASVYWYLHFQYNGFFFFSCAGLFIDYMGKKGLLTTRLNRPFLLLLLSCIPAYGLSVLWLQLPIWVFGIVALAALAQTIAIVMLIRKLALLPYSGIPGFTTLARFLLLCATFALVVKFTLQLGSTIPAVSKLAFGFRPIVIAYLHLVLLAFTSIFLLFYLYSGRILHFRKPAIAGLWIFTGGVFLNELILGLQGIAAFSYTLIPYVNESLFFASITMTTGLILLNCYSSQKSIAKSNI